MKQISSRDNPIYKDLRLLAGSAQARRKAARTLLDGVHLCASYLRHLGVPQRCVVSASAAVHPEVMPILAQCDGAGGQCIVLPDPLYHAISQVEHGVGLMFVIDLPVHLTLQSLTASAVMLDNLQDPGNLGSILRSAAAAGIGSVFCSPTTTGCWSPKVLRAAMGAHFLLKIHEQVDLAALIDGATVHVLATSSHAREPIYQVDLRRPVAWLFGHEGQGVSPDLLQRATRQVAIPHLGEMESLNVAACAAVCFFEQLRQTTAFATAAPNGHAQR